MKLSKSANNIFLNYFSGESFSSLRELLSAKTNLSVKLNGVAGSGFPVTIAGIADAENTVNLVLASDADSAMYIYNDLESLLGEIDVPPAKKRVLFFPTTYRKDYAPLSSDSRYMLLRAEVLRSLSHNKVVTVVTYPEALCEKSVKSDFIKKNSLHLLVGEAISIDFIEDVLNTYGFSHVDFVTDPGQFAIRGGICDIYSFADENPYRISFLGETVETIRTFDPGNQLTIACIQQIDILPSLNNSQKVDEYDTLIALLPENTKIWIDDLAALTEKIRLEYLKIIALPDVESWKYVDEKQLISEISAHQRIILNGDADNVVNFKQLSQLSFNRNFDLLVDEIFSKVSFKWQISIVSENKRQVERLFSIFKDLEQKHHRGIIENIHIENFSLSSGFIDEESKIAVYTDHQIFSRHQQARISQRFSRPERVTLNELMNLQPGDYVVHINHGVGRFAGLVKTEVDGHLQEAIRLIYKDGDELLVSIHALHRISRYVGKDGTTPTSDKLGGKSWENKKNKAKSKVKDIARDLIKLYAKRRASNGFAYQPDSYMQHELEASFIYEDTPDQEQATKKIKEDMEANFPMDRLVCGDVGFGKTEIAIRAAFKAVADGKQVAVLVPTTILALQHYRTFSDRLNEMPAKIEYLNRFRSTKEQKEVLKELEIGKIDIIIGTHRIVGKDIVFKDLGLLIIDEEQKFGVAAKERLRNIKANVDTLTLTATPIPRTLQFSLMGARDLSILRTPPQNRYPVQTEVRQFHPDIIKNAIEYEMSRGGQVYFVHNRVQNIADVAGVIQRLVPDAKIAIGHGQMDGKDLEQVMLGFINGLSDVLISTTIVENGLDISNANTIIINDAQNFGLSDLHQLRGRVGRSNKKAFCYLLTPPTNILKDDARKRLRAIAEFSDLGSGFQIAMRDLDIRGAGNLLGAEQSGFITEIGYEMYQKILDEALEELKTDEFGDLFPEEKTKKDYTKDVSIESDISLLFPDSYVPTITERLVLYKELNEIKTEEELKKFELMLIDRFGPIPKESIGLMNAVRMKWIARQIAVDKILLKNNYLSLSFTQNKESAFFSSNSFSQIIAFVSEHPERCAIKETNDRLVLKFVNISSVEAAISIMSEFISKPLSTKEMN